MGTIITFEMIANVKTSSPVMCNCTAHKELEEISETTRLKHLIKAPHQLNAITGNEYAMGLFNYLFCVMDVENFKPSLTGRV